ncbi:MAG: hypothetical protein KJO07_24815, partial [Deltaproteobacteria bacterium]|nr:hypothetical protein [Deltaproteobacteria bacterium]
MSRAKWRRWSMRILPWLVAAVVLAFLLSRYSVSEIAAEMARGNALGLLLPMTVMVVVSLLLVTLGDWLLLGQTLDRAPAPWDVLRARAATTILMALSYFVSGGGLAVWIARKTGSRLSQV